jgi:hypothetical protein
MVLPPFSLLVKGQEIVDDVHHVSAYSVVCVGEVKTFNRSIALLFLEDFIAILYLVTEIETQGDI